MKICTHNHSQFFYETENIPDHRSRRFGCCASLLGRIKITFSKAKSRIRAATRTRQAQNQLVNKEVRPALSSYHGAHRQGKPEKGRVSKTYTR